MAPTRHFGVTPQVSSAEVASAMKAGHGWLSAKAGKLLRVRYQKIASCEKGKCLLVGTSCSEKEETALFAAGLLVRPSYLPSKNESRGSKVKP